MKIGIATKSKTMTALVLQWPLAVPGTQKVCIAHQGITCTTNSVKYMDLTIRRMPKAASSYSMSYGTYENSAGTLSHCCS